MEFKMFPPLKMVFCYTVIFDDIHKTDKSHNVNIFQHIDLVDSLYDCNQISKIMYPILFYKIPNLLKFDFLLK